MRDRERARQRDRETARQCKRAVSPSLLLPFSLSLCLAACSVPLYKVAPLPKNEALRGGQTATVEGLEVTAKAFAEDDEAFARFDANLPLAGILVVEVKLLNRAGPTGKLSFALRETNGQSLARLEPKKMLKTVMKFEGVRLYPIEGKQQTLDQLQAQALPKKFMLAAQEERRGLLFFHAKRDVTQLKSLTLEIKGGKQVVTLPLP